MPLGTTFGPERPPCPRPDKQSFDDRDAALAAYGAIAAEPTFNVYRCVCGSWHGGNRGRRRPRNARGSYRIRDLIDQEPS